VWLTDDSCNAMVTLFKLHEWIAWCIECTWMASITHRLSCDLCALTVVNHSIPGHKPSLVTLRYVSHM